MSNKNPSTQFRYVLYEWIVNQAGSGQYGRFLKAVRRAVLFLIRLCFSTLFLIFIPPLYSSKLMASVILAILQTSLIYLLTFCSWLFETQLSHKESCNSPVKYE